MMMRIIAKERLTDDDPLAGYHVAALSTLPQGDECGQGLPPIECGTWDCWAVGFYKPVSPPLFSYG